MGSPITTSFVMPVRLFAPLVLLLISSGLVAGSLTARDWDLFLLLLALPIAGYLVYLAQAYARIVAIRWDGDAFELRRWWKRTSINPADVKEVRELYGIGTGIGCILLRVRTPFGRKVWFADLSSRAYRQETTGDRIANICGFAQNRTCAPLGKEIYVVWKRAGD